MNERCDVLLAFVNNNEKQAVYQACRERYIKEGRVPFIIGFLKIFLIFFYTYDIKMISMEKEMGRVHLLPVEIKKQIIKIFAIMTNLQIGVFVYE